MQATHVRFARDLESRLGVLDRTAYYSGTLYPDSRYFTGVERHKTHLKVRELNEILNLSDFEKGQMVHLYYDVYQSRYFKKLFSFTEVTQYSESWFQVTAAKIIEDSTSFKLLGDDKLIFKKLNFSNAPAGESDEQMSKWNDSMINNYFVDDLTLDKYQNFFNLLEPWALERLLSEYWSLKNNEKTVESINKIYDQVLKNVVA